MSLYSLLPPAEAGRLLQDDWPKSIFQHHASVDQLPELLRSGPLASLAELCAVHKGPVDFSKSSRSIMALNGSDLPPLELYAMGLTVYLAEAQQAIPGADAWLRDFAKDIGVPAHSISLGVFASPAGEGAPPHYDAQEVFSIQLQGEKHFEVAPMTEIAFPYGQQYSPGYSVYDDLYEQIETRLPDWREVEFQSVTMRPGSVLFMPRGTWHRTQVKSDSLAVSLVVKAPSIMDLCLKALRTKMLSRAEWRKPYYGEQDLLDGISDRLAELATLESAELQRALLTNDEKSALLSPNTNLIRIPDARLRLEDENDGRLRAVYIEVKRADGGMRASVKLNLGTAMVELLQWIDASAGIFSCEQLQQQFDQIPAQQLQSLLAGCARAGLLRVL